MLGENVNKMVFVVWAGAIVGGLFGVLMVLFPSAMDQVGDSIKTTTEKFIGSKSDEVSLSVNIPDQKSEMDYSWYKSKIDSDTDARTPLFEPNTTDLGDYNYRNDDTWLRLFNYPDGVEAWKKSIADSNYVKYNFDSVPSEALVSPFEAKDSKGNDITKNIKFKSAKVTKLETWDGKDISTDTDEAYIQWSDTHIPGIQFNHEYSDYKDMLYSIYGYGMTKGWVVKHSDGTIRTTLNPYDLDDGSWQYAYVSKAYITATYTVSDDSGNSATKSSSFVVSIDPRDHIQWSQQ